MVDKRPPAVRAADDAAQFDFGFGLQQDLFGGDEHQHVAARLRSVWVKDADVREPLIVGELVTAGVALSDWCLRGDDGSAPIPAGTVLEVVELREWGGGAAMVRELAPERAAAVAAVLSEVDRLSQ